MCRGLSAVLALAVGLAAPFASVSGQILDGSASGSIAAEGERVQLRYAYVVDSGGEWKLWFSDRLLDEAIFSGAPAPDGVSIVVVDLDANREATSASAWHPALDHASSGATTNLRVNVSSSSDTRLAGVAVLEAGAADWSFEARFDAPVSRIGKDATTKRSVTPVGQVDPAEREKVVAELEARGWELEPSHFRAAVSEGETEIVKLMLDAGMSPDAEGALWGAVVTGAEEITRVLLEAGAKIESPDFPRDGDLMMKAADSGSGEIVRLLAEAGADLNYENPYHMTPVAVAAEGGSIEAVQALIDAGANLDVRGDYGNVAILSALVSGQTDIVRLLLESGADVSQDAEKLLAYTEDPLLKKLILDAAARPGKARSSEARPDGPPSVTSGEQPAYTEGALRARVQGDVVLDVVIREDGEVGEVKVVRGLPFGLSEAAVEAVKTWTFEPARWSGTAVSESLEIRIPFRLPAVEE